jgi:hypothetical protein
MYRCESKGRTACFSTIYASERVRCVRVHAVLENADTQQLFLIASAFISTGYGGAGIEPTRRSVGCLCILVVWSVSISSRIFNFS